MKTKILCCFNPARFKENANWLKYNISKDVYGLYRYFFRLDTRVKVGGDSFVTK
jgi:hypothetical protein